MPCEGVQESVLTPFLKLGESERITAWKRVNPIAYKTHRRRPSSVSCLGRLLKLMAFLRGSLLMISTSGQGLNGRCGPLGSQDSTHLEL